MHDQFGMFGTVSAQVMLGLTCVHLGFAESGQVHVSSTVRKGDINVVNSQVVIGGASTGTTDSGLVVGKGKRVTRTLPVSSAFHGIDLSGVFKAEVICGAPASVDVRMEENLHALLTATVRDGILSLRFTKPVQTRESPHLKIVLPSLDVLQMSGSDTVNVTGLKGKRLRMTHEGTGAVTLAGQVDDFACRMSGIGEVDAGKLVCRSADVAVSGVGGVTCRPASKLKANLSGIGGVRCLTKPAAVEKQVTGVGDVEFAGK